MHALQAPSHSIVLLHSSTPPRARSQHWLRACKQDAVARGPAISNNAGCCPPTPARVWSLQAYGRLDILVSNAAVNPTAGALLDTSASALDKVWDINVKSAILLVAAARPHLARGSAVVFMSSLTAYT